MAGLHGNDCLFITFFFSLSFLHLLNCIFISTQQFSHFCSSDCLPDPAEGREWASSWVGAYLLARIIPSQILSLISLLLAAVSVYQCWIQGGHSSCAPQQRQHQEKWHCWCCKASRKNPPCWLLLKQVAESDQDNFPASTEKQNSPVLPESRSLSNQQIRGRIDGSHQLRKIFLLSSSL